MVDLIKTGVVLFAIVLLLRKKMSMSLVMPLGAFFLALLYLTPPREVLQAVYRGVFDPKSLDMTLTLMLTMVMEHILRTTGMLSRMVKSLSRAVPDRRIVMAAMPAMIGMLPSPGGAVFSAPMVEEAVGKHSPVSPEQKSFINYWYRHIWEYVSPLYPGVILVSGLTGLSTQTIFIAQLPFALSVVVWGAFFCFRGISKDSLQLPIDGSRKNDLLNFFATVSPIFFALLLTVLFRVNPGISLGGSVIALYLYHRYTMSQIVTNLKASVSMKALFLVLGIMIFQEVLKTTGALTGVSRFFSESMLPPHLLLIAIPFIAGVMTGLTVGYVGITFPLLLPLMGGVSPNPALVALAFASGFAGVMLSPVHLCYVLTCDFFKADMAQVYHRLFIPSALVLMAAIIPLLFF